MKYLIPSIPTHIKIVGHRGSSHLENSMQSFIKALQCGAIGIEFDIQLSKDRIPVVIHDDTLDRTTTGKGYVSDFTLPELKQLKLRNGDHISDETIPTLEEVLELCEQFHHRIPDIWINIEIKNPGATTPITKLVDQFIGQGHLTHKNMILSCFEHQVLFDVRKKGADYSLGILFADDSIDNTHSLINAIKPVSLHLSQHQIKSPIIQQLYGHIQLVTWFDHEQKFPNNIQEINKAIQYGSDIIITNHPCEIAQQFKPPRSRL